MLRPECGQRTEPRPYIFGSWKSEEYERVVSEKNGQPRTVVISRKVKFVECGREDAVRSDAGGE